MCSLRGELSFPPHRSRSSGVTQKFLTALLEHELTNDVGTFATFRPLAFEAPVSTWALSRGYSVDSAQVLIHAVEKSLRIEYSEGSVSGTFPASSPREPADLGGVVVWLVVLAEAGS